MNGLLNIALLFFAFMTASHLVAAENSKLIPGQLCPKAADVGQLNIGQRIALILVACAGPNKILS